MSKSMQKYFHVFNRRENVTIKYENFNLTELVCINFRIGNYILDNIFCICTLHAIFNRRQTRINQNFRIHALYIDHTWQFSDRQLASFNLCAWIFFSFSCTFLYIPITFRGDGEFEGASEFTDGALFGRFHRGRIRVPDN